MEEIGRTITSAELNAKYQGQRVRTVDEPDDFLREFFPDEPAEVHEGVVDGFYDTPGEMVIIATSGEIWAVFPETTIEIL